MSEPIDPMDGMDLDGLDALDVEEQRLGSLFADVQPPAGMRRWEHVASRRRVRRWWGALLGLLIGAGGERRLRPLAAALLVPVLALAIGGGFGLHAHFTGTAGPGANPPARANAAMAFDADHGVVVMFGGAGRGGALSDTWTWDGQSWTQQHPAGSPSPRSGAVMAYDAKHHQVVLYGGRSSQFASTADPSQETWTWDGSSWHHMVTHNHPALIEPSLTFDPATAQLLLVGEKGVLLTPAPGTVIHGGGGSGGTAQVFQGISQGLQAHPSASATPASSAHGPGPVLLPAPAQGHSVTATITAPSRVTPAHPVDTWLWTGDDWTLGAAIHIPSAFAQLQPVWDESTRQMQLTTEELRTVCVTATAGGSASGIAIKPPAASPPSGGSAGWSGYTPEHQGGSTTAAPVPQVAQSCRATLPGNCAACSPSHVLDWDGKSWNESHSSAVTWAVHADPATGGVLAVEFNDTYSRVHDTVRILALPAGLRHRNSEALAGDTVRNVEVLFGGYAPGGYAADTWTWDGSTWTHRAGPPPPAPTPLPYVQAVPQTTCSPGAPLPSINLQSNSNDAVLITVLLHPGASGPCKQLAFGAAIELLDPAGKLLPVTHNRYVLDGPDSVTLDWRNWCGAHAGSVKVDWSAATVSAPITAFPPCVARGQASTLLGPVNVNVVPGG